MLKVRWEIHQFCCNFLAESSSERIFKIGQHFPKLCLRTGATPFLTHGVDTNKHKRAKYMLQINLSIVNKTK